MKKITLAPRSIEIAEGALAHLRPELGRKLICDIDAAERNTSLHNHAVKALDRSYRPDIDGLRAIAISSVVLYHGARLVSGGFTGVDIFFVISGYLIGGHIYSELRAGSFSYLRFYQRRAKRILPAFYVVLAFSMLATLLLLTPSEAREFGCSAAAATLSASNIWFWRITNYFNPTNETNPLLMTWSLGVEEQFYVVVPLLMVLLARIRRGLLMPAILTVCALSFLFAWLALPKHSTFVFYMLPARAWELGAGVALAVVELNRERSAPSGPLAQASSVAGLALMLGPLFLLSGTTPFPGATALPSVLGTALVIAAPASWINRRLLSVKPLVFVGRVSYSWYLWHWPLLAFMQILYGSKLPWVTGILVVAAAFAAAILSYYFVEQPFRRSRRAPAPLLFRYAAVSVVILAACTVIWRSHGFPQRFPALAQAEAEEAGRQRAELDKCMHNEDDVESILPLVCSEPSTTGSIVAVWGDSHAAALAPGLRSAAIAEGYGFVEFSRGDCPPLTGASLYSPQAPFEARECFQFNRMVLSLLEANHNIRIVFLASSWDTPFNRSTPGPGERRWWLTGMSAKSNETPTLDASRELLKHSLAATIQSLQASGKQVVVFEDVPKFSVNPVSRVRTASIPVRQALAAMLGTGDASDPGFASPEMVSENAMIDSAIEQAVVGLQGVALYDLRPEFCSSTSHCVYRDGGRLLYSDRNHLTAYGSRYALRDFRFPTLAELKN
jgi:peptidoglycan/LPS O-acetylase OafA/YrhL